MRKVVAVASAAGLHARAAGLIAAAAADQPVPVTASVPGRKPVPADSVLGLLTLAATHGTEVTLEAHGDDAAAALDALAKLVATDLDVVRG